MKDPGATIILNHKNHAISFIKATGESKKNHFFELDINGTKANKIKDPILESLNLKRNNSFIEYLAKKDKEKFINLLKNSGYYFADVKLKIINNSNNTVNLIYDVNLGKKAKITLKPLQKGDVLKTHANVIKLKRYINYKPTTSLEKGVSEFIKWFKDYYLKNK